MPIRFELQPETLFYSTEGDVEYEDGVRTLRAGLGQAAESFRAGRAGKFDVLFDVRQSTEDRTGEELRGIADLLGAHASFLTGHAAVVAGDAFHIGLARVLGAYAAGNRVEVRVFLDAEEAREWLQSMRLAA